MWFIQILAFIIVKNFKNMKKDLFLLKFKKLLNKLQVSPEKFGDNIGVGKSSIYKIIRGDTKKITESFADKVISVYPEFTKEYLLSFNFEDLLPNKDSIEKRDDYLLNKIENKTLEVLDMIDKEKIISYLLLKEAEFNKFPAFLSFIEKQKTSKRLRKIAKDNQ